MKKHALVYVAGPFRAPDAYQVRCNIRRAEAAALEIWRAGHATICPHSNTANFSGAAPDELWLAGDIVMLTRCDAAFFVNGWWRSAGAVEERAVAVCAGIAVFEELPELIAFLDRYFTSLL